MTTQMITTTGVRPRQRAGEAVAGARDPFAERDLAACDIRGAEVRHSPHDGLVTVTLTVDDLDRLTSQLGTVESAEDRIDELRHELDWRTEQLAEHQAELAELTGRYDRRLAEMTAQIVWLTGCLTELGAAGR